MEESQYAIIPNLRSAYQRGKTATEYRNMPLIDQGYCGVGHGGPGTAHRRAISRPPNREDILFLENNVVRNFKPYSLHTYQNILDLTDLDRLDSKEA